MAVTPTLNALDANARQVGGLHYRTPYQHWDLVADCGLGYFEGQITKYLSRHNKKNGLQDVQKAAHFLDKLIELRELGYPPHNPNATPGKVTRFCDASELEGGERVVVQLLCFWRSKDQLLEAQVRVQEVAATYATPAYVDQDSRPTLTPAQRSAVDETAGLTDSEEGGPL